MSHHDIEPFGKKKLCRIWRKFSYWKEIEVIETVDSFVDVLMEVVFLAVEVGGHSSMVLLEREGEGCLSNPGAYGITKRPKAVTVRAMNRNGEEYELNGTDLLARAICHECDHLDGKLYTDVQIRPLSPEELK